MDDAIGHLDEVVVDCLDPTALATFWDAVLGRDVVVRRTDWVYVHDPATGVRIAFQQVPEPKGAKNRLHLDDEVADIAAAIPRCVALGARVVGDLQHDEAGSFQVMLDPEGHEFCLVR
jgi:predicted enzyme related to lactoylglutathione lyase